jgi:hypothetical protein
MLLPDKSVLRQFYAEWFESCYCMKPAKAPDATLEFALAALQRFSQRQDGDEQQD